MNPHPTRSKPCKIGRKHTGEPQERVKAQRRRAAVITEAMRVAKLRVYKRKVHAYFVDERATHPGPKP